MITIRLSDEHDPNADPADAVVAGGAYLDSLHGDWSWKPERDKALGARMVTFRGVPRSAAELAAHARWGNS